MSDLLRRAILQGQGRDLKAHGQLIAIFFSYNGVISQHKRRLK